MSHSEGPHSMSHSQAMQRLQEIQQERRVLLQANPAPMTTVQHHSLTDRLIRLAVLEEIARTCLDR
jgi:hypothetical protein